ncbi:MAG: hypothetical protein ACREL6_01090, partial [Gemmatimonadales bacterium]
MNHSLAGTSADWVWLAILLPFIGFLVNGAIAFLRPKARVLVSVIAVGVMIASFRLAVLIFLAVNGAHPETPYVVSLWQWIPAGSLQLDFAFQVDQL